MFVRPAYARIKYILSAQISSSQGLIPNPNQQLQTQVLLPIKQSLQHVNFNIKPSSTSKVVCCWCCCCPRGNLRMVGHMAKDAFYIGEHANIPVDVDNSDCGADIESVQATVVMNMNLNASGFVRTVPIKLERPESSVNRSRIPGGSQRIGSNCVMIPVDLKTEQLAPSCHASIIQCNYELQIKSNVDTCQCCSVCRCCCSGDVPKLVQPIFIANRQSQSNFNNDFSKGMEWKPQRTNPAIGTIPLATGYLINPQPQIQEINIPGSQMNSNYPVQPPRPTIQGMETSPMVANSQLRL